MDVNLLDPAAFRTRQPYEVYRWLRANDPVHWHANPEGRGFWVLTRHADIKVLETNSEVFSSEPNTLLNDEHLVGDETHKQLLFSDPPRHTAHRRYLAAELSLTQVRSKQADMGELVDAVIDEVIEKGECDLVEDISGKLASFVIADLLGLPRQESLELFHASDVLTRGGSLLEGPGAEALAVMNQHAGDAWKTFSSGQGNDGALARIVRTEIDGMPIDQMQFAIDFYLLVAAGGDTSRNALSTGMLALFQHPEQHRMLVENPSLVPQAVEEILRWDPPIIFQARTATRDAEVGGQKIAKGEKVVSYYGAGNRDPEVFTDPETFDITRKSNPHLTFGAGRHFCLGSHLARQELVIMFTAIMSRMPDIKLAGPAQWHDLPEVPSVSGPASIQVSFTPGQRKSAA
ncbi:cytochrome P450 [Nocardia miyunensis]|uniref:cytochrome P450 n=1 Tax=Nocardia miyunensis TaxID=282684 RepID=UPI000832B42B|nr:cytochrome P450 [Nocardia miyunensis]